MGARFDPVGWWSAMERPLRRLPRLGALAVLLLALLACLWSIPAAEQYDQRFDADVSMRTERGDRRDMDLYESIARRVAAGESYYTAALDEQRNTGYPTRPFVVVRTPVLAWGSLAFGQTGWRVIAAGLWLTTLLGLVGLLSGRTSLLERAGAVLAAGAFGAVAFMPQVGLSHEIVSGLFLSAALALYRPRRWWPSLLLAACGLAVREHALPFVLLWAAFAASQRRWREFAAVAAVIALFAAGMALHAGVVASAQLPGDPVSPPWTGLQGPALALHGLHTVTLLQTLPAWLGPPLAVLPLLGWIAVGGRTGLFAALWAAGYAFAVSLFGRQEHFYWLSLLIPVYGAGLAFVPRALGDLVSALRRRPGAAGSGFPVG
jgi:hypothetical protein